MPSENPNPPLSIARQEPSPIPEMGIVGSLAAPGLPVADLSNSYSSLDRLSRALGLAGDVASGVAGVMGQVRFQKDKQQAEIDSADRAHASLSYRSAAATELPKIQTNQWLVPAGQPVEQYVDSILKDRTSGMSEAFREAYIQNYKPVLLGAFTNQQDGIRQQNLAEDIKLRSEGVINARTMPEIQEQVAAVRTLDPTMPESEVLARLVVPSGDSASKTGDLQRLELAIDALGGRFPEKVQEWQARFKESKARKAQESEQQVKDNVAKMLDERQPSSLILEQITQQQASGAIDNVTALGLKETVRQKDAAVIQDLQQTSTDRFTKDVVFGKITSDDAVAEISRRSALPENDPEFMGSGTTRDLLNMTANRVEVDARKKVVAYALSPEGIAAGGPALGPEFDQAFVEQVSGSSLSTIQRGKDSYAIVGVRDPFLLATQADQLGRVPEPVSTWIRTQLQSGDQTRMTEGATALAWLAKQRPGLAEQVLSSIPDADRASMVRARYILDRATAEWPAPENAPADQRTAMTKSWVSQKVAEAMRLQPAQLDNDTSDAAIWYGDPTSKVSRMDTVSKSQKDLMSRMLTASDDRGLRQYFRNEDPIAPTPSQAQEYASMVRQEYLTAMSMPGMIDDPVAVAKDRAFNRFIEAHPPVYFNGEVYLSNAGGVKAGENIDAVVRKELDGRVAMPYGTVDEVVDDHRLVFDKEQGGWILINKATGMPYSFWSSEKNEYRPYVTDGIDHSDVDPRAKLLQDVDAAEAKGRAIRANRSLFPMLVSPGNITPIP